MSNQSSATKGFWAAAPKARDAVKAGYLDAIMSMPFADEYERAGSVWQANYERGRLLAASFIGAKRPFASWPKGARRDRRNAAACDAFSATMSQVLHANGPHSWPGQ